MQYSPVCERRLNRIGIARWALHTPKLFQSMLDLARGIRRGIEREVQHGGSERGGGRDHRHMVRGGKAGAVYSKIGKRVTQQCVPALEPLNEILLPTRTRGQG